MRMCVVYPQAEFGSDPELIREYAVRAEELGFSQIVAYDHVLGADPSSHKLTGPYNHQTPFMEPFVLFGHLSAVTKEIELAMGVLVLPQRQTALVAKQAATLDRLSAGRLVLGVGVGWNQVEYLSLNCDFSRRGQRIEEQIELLRLLWSQPLVDFEGKFDLVDSAAISPRPIADDIPIWLGGWHDRVLQRVGRLGDGWFAFSGHPRNRSAFTDSRRIRRPEDLSRRVPIFAREALKYGRNPTEISISVLISSVGFDKLEAWHPLEWAKRAKRWSEVGASHAVLSTLDLGFSPKQHLEALAEFRSAWDEHF
ncbi:MAG: LLM class F420-dependent oxidoreductase [Acidimicrobiaceae bacterium]|nr:LLM class F420-dependent oxidoreductase [Acidimicrobiaceae bacterium]